MEFEISDTKLQRHVEPYGYRSARHHRALQSAHTGPHMDPMKIPWSEFVQIL